MFELPGHSLRRPFTRRELLRYGGSLGVGVAALSGGGLWHAASALALKKPDSLPDPTRPAGSPSEALPFDHLIVIMIENHSFDNLLGALKHSGQPKAKGLTLKRGVAQNSNPGPEGPVYSFPIPSTAQGDHVSQSWNATHQQIDGGRMDGFVRSVEDVQPMGYWTEDVLPFAYSLARTFCLANRWFCSAPC